jgi:hypothetical protein
MKHARKDYNKRVQDSENKIPKDEPVFLLRAQDKVAARVVRYWAMLHKEAGGDPKMVARAKAHAKRMEAWPKKKLADG